MDEVTKRGWLTLVGNHDRACTDPEILEWFNDDAAAVVRWTVDTIGEDRIAWLRGLPDSHVEHDVLLVHASPRDHIYEYVLDTAVAFANLELLNGGVCFHGHTHVPGIFVMPDGQVTHEYRVDKFSLKGPSLINPGSVGQPRDGGPMTSYGVRAVHNASLEFRRGDDGVEGRPRAFRLASLRWPTSTTAPPSTRWRRSKLFLPLG